MTIVGLGLTEAWQLLEAAQTDPRGDSPPVEQTPQSIDPPWRAKALREGTDMMSHEHCD